MGQCYIFTKKKFLEQMDKLIKDDEAVIFSTIKQGRMIGSSKKRLKSFETAFSNDCFKDSENIVDLMKCVSGGLILLKEEYWSDSVKDYIEKDANN